MAEFRPAYLIALPQLLAESDAAAGVTLAESGVAVIPWVNSFMHEPQPAVAITLTQGGRVVEGHPDGVRIEDVTVNGTVFNPELRSITPDYANTEHPSYTMMRSLADLIRQCLQGEQRTVYFYAIDEGVYLEAVPIRMRFDRGRIPTRYTIALRGLRQIQAINLINVWPAAFRPAVEKHWYDDLAKTYSTCKAALVTAQSWYYQGLAYAKMPFDVANKVLATMEELTAEVNAMVGGLSDLLHQPYLLAQRAKNLAAYALQTAAEAKQTVWDFTFQRAIGFKSYAGPESATEVLAPNDGYALNLRNVAAQLDAIAQSLYSMAERALASAGQSTPVERYWTIGRSDTLYSIAAAVYADPSRAQDLATANGLRYPWIASAGGPGLAKVGDRLRIPGVGVGTLQTVPTGQETNPEQVVYGTDIRLDRDGGWHRVGDDDDVDLDLVSGVECVEIDLWQRMNTEFGSDRNHATYGLVPGVGQHGTAGQTATYLVNITNGLLQDDRVQTVTGLKIVETPNGLDWEGLIKLVTGLELASTGVAA